MNQDNYKIVLISELLIEMSFEDMAQTLLGVGPYVIMERHPNDEDFWFTMAGENRFKTRKLAEKKIRDRIQMLFEIEAFKEHQLANEPQNKELDIESLLGLATKLVADDETGKI